VARIAVVGAGVVGAASAWLLCRQGHEVILVDRNAGPAEGASRSNGAQLSYAYGDALGSPSLLRHLPAILLGRDPAYRARLSADPEFLIWGLRFAINCLPSRFVANTRYLLAMADATRRLLQDLLAEFDLAFDYAVAGKMILYPSAESFAKTEDVRRLKQSLGIRHEALDRAAATALEPALDLYPHPIGPVLYSPDDAVGRPDAFSAALIARLSAKYGLRTLFRHEARAVTSHRGRVTGLTFRAYEPLDCDQVVLTTGYGTDLLPAGQRLAAGIWPVQGYSITAQATPAAMRISITDVRRKTVFARIGEQVRMAGLADIGKRRFAFQPHRFETFRVSAIEAFGGAFCHGPRDELSPWSGGRPCTPSSRPVIRPGDLQGLYLNLGHGTLGWTLCLGAAQQLMDVMGIASPSLP
jgi:D-amino-acid dehydrogenase